MKEAIIANPKGDIYRIAQQRLSKTTFPPGVKNPLPRKVRIRLVCDNCGNRLRKTVRLDDDHTPDIFCPVCDWLMR